MSLTNYIVGRAVLSARGDDTCATRRARCIRAFTRRTGSLLVCYRTAAEFVRALRAGRYDVPLVGDSDRELNWARAAGWAPIAIDRGTIQGFALLPAPEHTARL